VENQYGGHRHVVSYNIIFVSKAGTVPYLMVFLNLTVVEIVVVSEISRGPHYCLTASVI